MYATKKARMREEITHRLEPRFTLREVCDLWKLARRYDDGEIPGDAAPSPPPFVHLITTPRSIHLGEIVCGPDDDGSPYRTFCHRRRTGEEQVEWMIPWGEAKVGVTCPGCQALGIAGRELP